MDLSGILYYIKLDSPKVAAVLLGFKWPCLGVETLRVLHASLSTSSEAHSKKKQIHLMV
jgi:hypothetical protein